MAIFYFLSYNFNLNREPYVDEIAWCGTAKEIINLLPNIRLSSCPINPMIPHLFGIPFIAALPNLLFGTNLENSIYFMGLIVIVSIVLFLFLIKNDKWCFLFFYFSLIMTLNRHLWLRKLHLALVYGEGIVALFFLLVMYELYKIKKGDIGFKQLLLLAFLIGLFAFAKHPMNYLFLSFIPILLFIKPINFRDKIILVSVFTFPFLIKLLIMFFRFRGCYGSSYGAYIHGIGSLFRYNFSSIKPMLAYLIDGYTMPLFFSGLSLIFIFLTFKGKEFLFLTPFIALLLFIFYLYVTVFSEIEYESSARYFSEGMLALYYLGGIGLSKGMESIKGKYITMR